jgi:hypothetical protein
MAKIAGSGSRIRILTKMSWIRNTGFGIDILNHREGGGVVFYQVFLLSPFTVYSNALKKLLREFTKYKSQGKAVEVTLNSKEENS